MTGKVLAARFRLVRAIGGDAAFSRWAAQDLELDAEVVEVAFMPPEVASSARALSAIKAAVAESLKLLHPNIASARAFVDNQGAPFFVFDHVEGRPLDACLDEWGKLGENEAKALLEPLASALDYAHAKGIVHGDVRPSNIIVNDDAVPSFVGFCVTSGMREAVARTRGGAAAGPIAWMSPEQLMGQAPSPAQDIYSLAAIAYECLSGHPPFHRGQVEFQILNGAPEPLENDTPFTRAVMRALAKDPAMRPKTCAEMMAGDAKLVVMPEVVSAVPVNVPKARRPLAPAPAPASVPAPASRQPARPPAGAAPAAFGQPMRVMPPGMPPARGAAPGAPQRGGPGKPGAMPPVPVQARRKTLSPEELEERRRRLAKVEERRRSLREAERRRDSADAVFHAQQSQGATRKAMLGLSLVAAAVIAAILLVVFSGRKNVELANAPAKKVFTETELGRYRRFMGIEFGQVIEKTPKKDDPIVFGGVTNRVGNVSLDGRSFEVELAEPVFKVFPMVRVSLVDTEGGRRISAITFEKDRAEGVKADKAKKVVSKIASLVSKEFNIDMGDDMTAINDAYFRQRYSDDFIDIRISSVVAPESTSISFSIESRIVRSMEVVVLR